jgi:putative sterol carrier protein/predicted XRE-type DNA-binding protein
VRHANASNRFAVRKGGDVPRHREPILGEVNETPDPVPALKQQLAHAIRDRLRGTPHFRRARLLGVDQPRASDLDRGRLERFSLQRLARFVARLDGDVTMSVTWRTARLWIPAAGRGRQATLVGQRRSCAASATALSRSVTMPHHVFSEDWVNAWAAEIRASDDYRRAAERWEWPVALVIRADADGGIPDDRHVYLDLRRGECREARLVSADEARRADFVLSADAQTWKGILEGKVDPIGGLLRGTVKLEKGSMMMLAMHAPAAKALVATATRVDSEFPESP